jgi:hypothetical protein
MIGNVSIDGGLDRQIRKPDVLLQLHDQRACVATTLHMRHEEQEEGTRHTCDVVFAIAMALTALVTKIPRFTDSFS